MVAFTRLYRESWYIMLPAVNGAAWSRMLRRCKLANRTILGQKLC